MGGIIGRPLHTLHSREENTSDNMCEKVEGTWNVRPGEPALQSGHQGVHECEITPPFSAIRRISPLVKNALKGSDACILPFLTSDARVNDRTSTPLPGRREGAAAPIAICNCMGLATSQSLGRSKLL